MVYHLLVVVVIVSHVALLPGGRLLIYILLENDIYQQVSSSQTGHRASSRKGHRARCQREEQRISICHPDKPRGLTEYQIVKIFVERH